MKAIPVAVREPILKLYAQSKGTSEIAACFGYCVAAVRRVRQHFNLRGTLQPQTNRCGRKTLLTTTRQKRLWRLLQRRPNATRAALGAAAERLVLVDESGANTQMTRRYGHSPIGQRPACAVPHGHDQTTTLIAAAFRAEPEAAAKDAARRNTVLEKWVGIEVARYLSREIARCNARTSP